MARFPLHLWESEFEQAHTDLSLMQRINVRGQLLILSMSSAFN
jgi:hypothetical protein